MIKLYSYWRSSCSWRVRIALNLKQIAYQIVPVNLVSNGGEQHTEVHRARNPMAQIPVIEWVHAGATYQLSQSVAICEYLESRYPKPPLIPRESQTAARCREIVEIINAGIQPLQNLYVLNQLESQCANFNRSTWSVNLIERGFTAIEKKLSQVAGQFSVGDNVTLADLFIIPQIYNARRFGLNLGPFDQIRKIESNCAHLEAFKRAHPDNQPDTPAA